MSAPVKPWETPGINYQNFTQFPVNEMSGSPVIQDRLHGAINSSASATAALSSSPPQVPPRPSQQSTFNSRFGTSPGYGSGPGYGNFGTYSGYGGYSNPLGYGGYSSMYSPYSSYGAYGYNRLGDVARSTFAQHAEETSRPAFESIETIVNVVNSIGMMLDSTFQAVYNSFRAVIGVADNFTRLKTQLVQIFSALAFIRTLKYMFRKILELIRLRPKGEADELWRQAFQAAVKGPGPDGVPKRSSWPILLFFGIIMGGPYLIWKLLSAFSGSTDEKGWAKGEDDHFVARANFSFQGQSTDELSFVARQTFNVAPKELQPKVRGWLLASTDGQKVGMIPANYVTVLGKRKGSKQSNPEQPSIVYSKSSSSFGQSFPSNTKQASKLPDTELDSIYTSHSDTQSQMPCSPSDMNNQVAADILNDWDQ